MKKTNLVILFCVISVCLFGKQAKAAGAYGLNNPIVYDIQSVYGSTTWDCIYFGNYWQEDTNSDGIANQDDEKTPIKWRVLSIDGNDAFLVADQVLDVQPYHTDYSDVTWETCSLRSWLNESFYQTAFAENERAAIKETLVTNENTIFEGWDVEGGNDTIDNIYCLSLNEATNVDYGFPEDIEYGSIVRIAKATTYAINCGGYSETGGGISNIGKWWLRSPGSRGSDKSIVSGMNIRTWGYGQTEKIIGILPCLHLDLSKNTWMAAGTIQLPEGNPAPPTTPTVKPTLTPAPTESPEVLTKPTQVKSLTAKNVKTKKAQVSWKKVTGAKGYQVQYATNKKFKSKKTKTVKKTKVTIKKLKKKKIYYFRVRAYKLDGTKKVYGKWSAVKKVKVKK